MHRLSKTGLVFPDCVTWGTHLCQFYETKDDLLEVLVPYFHEGLLAGEACLWIVSDPIAPEEAKEALAACVPNIGDFLDSRQLEIVWDKAWCLAGGCCNLDVALRGWIKKAETAAANGFSGLRASGNVTCLPEGEWKELAACEEQAHLDLSHHKIIALCSYPLDQCTGAQFIHMVSSHDYALVRRRGAWECIENQSTRGMLGRVLFQRTVLASSICPVSTSDLEGRITYANPAALKAWRFEHEEEMLGHAVTEFWQDSDQLVDLLSQIRTQGEGIAELQARRKDGSVFYAAVYASLTYDAQGTPTGMVASFFDVTARKEAEAKLRASENRYRALIGNISLGIGMIDRNYRVVTVNEMMARTNGRTCEDFVGQECYRIHEERSHICSHCPGTKAMATGKPAETEVHIARHHHEPKDVRIRAYPVLGTDGVPEGFIEVVEDITARKRSQQLLQQSYAELQSICNGIVEGLMITDVETRKIQRVNFSFCQMTGYAADELLGTSFENLHPQEEVAKDRGLFQKAAAGAVSFIEARPVLRDDGSIFYADITVHPIVYNGRPCLLALFRDITERKQAAEELAKAKQDAEAANWAKSAFLANVSHELRTPMTAILGFADVLWGEDAIESAPPERIEAIQTIVRNGQYLLDLINGILDLSKIEAGKHDLNLRPCSPHQVITEVIGTMRVRADAKGLALAVEYRDAIPERILTDPLGLRQILVNLVGNAIKFTEVGSIRVVVQRDRQSESERLRLSIIDTGIGIAEKHIPLLFQPFSQVDASARRRFSGTGLGLAISQRLAAGLGGDITVESVPGQGSTFTLSIAVGTAPPEEPAPCPADAAKPQPSSPHAVSRLDARVILVEDGPDNQRLIGFLLRKVGAVVTVVDDGKKGVEAVSQAWKTNQPFDVVLMDMQMPVMDGYEATRSLRNMGYPGPIIALTAHAMTEDRQKCLEAGCDDYVAKPLEREAFLQMVARHVTRQASPADG